MWGGRALASAFVLLCALLADHSRPTDASVVAPANETSTPPSAVQSLSDFDLVIGAKQGIALAANGSASAFVARHFGVALATANAAGGAAGTNNQQRITFTSLVIADPSRSAAIYA